MNLPEFFQAALEASWQGSLVILLILLLRPLFGMRVPARWRSLLWTLALLRLLVPGMRTWLISKGMKVPEYNDGERLIDAAEREDLPGIRRLLATGVDVNYRGESDWMPLCKAAVWGCPRAVKLLLENKADPNPPRYSYSTLELANTPEIADLLVAGGAKVKPEDIGYSVGQGSVKMVQWFLDHGVNPTQMKSGEDDPQSLLFRARTTEVAELLIARGVPVNIKDKLGNTALRQALQRRDNPAKLVALLLKHGADPNERYSGGYATRPASQRSTSPAKMATQKSWRCWKERSVSSYIANKNATTENLRNFVKASPHKPVT